MTFIKIEFTEFFFKRKLFDFQQYIPLFNLLTEEILIRLE